VSGEAPLVPSTPFAKKNWLERASEAYAQADRMTHPDAKRVMLEITAGHQRTSADG
jgi:hypothetical protein